MAKIPDELLHRDTAGDALYAAPPRGKHGTLIYIRRGEGEMYLPTPAVNLLRAALTGNVTVYELRKGPDDDPHPTVLGLYTELVEAAKHGDAEFEKAHGTSHFLRWLPENAADDAAWSLYAADDEHDGDEEETEWYIVPRTATTTYTPTPPPGQEPLPTLVQIPKTAGEG